jgi:hypothetical protein
MVLAEGWSFWNSLDGQSVAPTYAAPKARPEFGRLGNLVLLEFDLGRIDQATAPWVLEKL